MTLRTITATLLAALGSALALAAGPDARPATRPAVALANIPATTPATQPTLARAWPKGGPPVLWTVDLGEGWAAPAVSGDDVYVLDRVNDKQDVLRCLDLATGKERWSVGYDAPGRLPQNGSRNTPAVDDRRVYTCGPYGHVQCVDRETHQVLWAHHLVDDFKDKDLFGIRQAQVPKWGFTQTPLLYKETAILAPQAEKAGLVAYDRATGAVKWTSPGVGRNWFSHVTPTLVTLGGVDQVVTLANKHRGRDPAAIISGVDANTGELLWQVETWRAYNMPIPSPVQVAPDALFVTGGYRIGCFGLKVAKGDDGKWKAEFTFKNNDVTAHIHTPQFHDGHVYANSFDQYHNAVNNGLVCVSPLDGKLLWKTGPDLVFDSGHVLVRDGLIFAMNGKSGELHLAEANPKAYRELARAKVLEGKGGNVWGIMALAPGGRLLVRDLKQMRCLDVSAK